MLRFGPPQTLPASPAAYGALSLGAVVLLVGWVRRRRSILSPTPAPRKKKAPLGYHSPLCSSAEIAPLENFDLRTTVPAKFRPWLAEKPLATTPCPASELILLDAIYPAHISLRKRILQTHPTATLIHSSPASLPAITELYTFLLRTYLPLRFPTHFALSPSGTLFTNLITHDTHPIAPPPHTNPSDPAPALRILATSIEEDVLMLLPDSAGVYRLAAASVLFPSERLETRGVGALRPGLENAVVRWSWGVVADDLYGDEEEEDVAEEVEPEDCWVRVERQVLWKLPGTGAAVVMVKTYLYSLEELRREGLGQELASALQARGEGRKEIVEYLRD